MRALTPAEAEQERMRKMLETSPKAYVDKVMVPGDLPAGAADRAPEEDAGDFRSWFSETRLVTSHGSGDALDLRSTRELGQRIGYRQETLNHGNYELLADVRSGNGLRPVSSDVSGISTTRRSQRVTLRNIAFPVSTRVFADTAAGDTFSEVTDALTRNYRLSLGTRPVRGLAARVYSAEFDLRAGTGRRGNLVGGPYAGFEPASGDLSWLGASRRTAAGLFGLQHTRATGDGSSFSGHPGDEQVDSTAAAWRVSGNITPGVGYVARLTAIRSQTRAAGSGADNATGWFAEGSLLTDHARQEFGLFRAEPGLRFGDARLHDSRGAYWRIDGARSGIGWGFGAQVDAQPAEQGFPGSRHVGVQANAQWQVDRRNGVGGTLSVEQRRFGDAGTASFGAPATTQSVYATAYYHRQAPRTGRSSFVLTVRRNQELVANGSTATGEEWSWDQEWLLGSAAPDRPELVTSLGIAHDRDEGGSRISPTAGVRLSFAPTARWTMSGNLRYTSTRSNLSTTQGLSGFLDSEYAFDSGWRVGAALSLNQLTARVHNPALLRDDGPQLFRTRDTTLSLWARWETSAGQTERGLGDIRAVGAGALQGRVFFDENRDGAQQPQEQGVQGVEVILDGRFRTTTDNWGRFTFPLVATGVHHVTVLQESVPLPWGSAQERGWRAEVPLRGQAQVVVPVVKVGE